MRMPKKTLVALLVLTVLFHLFPARAKAASDPPFLVSQSAVLMDAATGQVLYEKNMDEGLYPASITKILTVLLALENSSLSDAVTVTDAVLSVPRDTTHISLTPGEQVTMEQLVYAAFLESANDACVAIAVHVAGSIGAFCEMMNKRALEAGATNSHFANPHGLFAENHTTTAHDMAAITREALKNPEFLKVFTSRSYEMPPNNKQSEKRYFSTKLDFFKDTPYAYSKAIGGKNGWITAAGHTLVTAAESDGVRLICVVMKSEAPGDKFADTIALFNYGFDNFRPVSWKAGTLLYQNFAPADSGSNQVRRVRYQNDEPVTFLLHKSLSLGNCRVTYQAEGDAVFARVTLKNEKNAVMYPGILTLALSPPAPPEGTGGKEDSPGFSLPSLPSLPAFSLPDLPGLFSKAAGWGKAHWQLLAAGGCGFVLLLFLLFLRRQIKKSRKRKKLMRERRLMLEIQRRQQLEQLRMKQQLGQLRLHERGQDRPMDLPGQNRGRR